ncbi:autotransporter assembly complex protein TamA [Moraxella cuniculi]|uniref:Outer membrane protein/protective antigen OMA87 n=1 Tax=Moraxella cuniculi TaxID=34061 RepID=A0A3S4QT46_9GAMM|nr:BamA/TamA family outer membrane protein [Moraxella cuniculi]VEG13678.1 Outer membrane protein/protective antigen OMA87 [Moraxella cuniculi]
MSKLVLLSNRPVVPVQLWVLLPLLTLSTLASAAQDNNAVNQKPSAVNNSPVIPTVNLLSPEQIEARLAAANNHQLVASESSADKADTPIARINESFVPIGLDTTQLEQLPSVADDNNQQENTALLNPDDYMPQYEAFVLPDIADEEQVQTKTPQVNVVQRLYDRMFNDGVSKAPRLKAKFYRTSETGERVPISAADKKIEPYANIKAALEDITQESAMDLRGSQARLRQTALAAARAVGYYEVDLQIIRTSLGEVEVLVRDLGEPVRVGHRAIEVRGAGADNPAFTQTVDKIALQSDEVFNHGRYETSKYSVEQVSAEQGFFDGKWLDKSVDVVLPDNVADVNLIYDTGEQYDFDEVVFFTIDKQTGRLTTDPNKLPVKPELLQQLLSFEMGDAYNRQAVRALSNDLLATGYFNMVNTETVLPESEQTAGINFEQSSGGDADNNQTVASDEQQGESITLADGTMVDIAPIEFSASELIKDKLNLVAAKARRLYDMPDDRVLAIDNNSKKNRSLLGRISDAVSGVARAILPDEPEAELFNLPEGAERPELAGRKTPQQVYQDKKVPLYIFVMTDKPRDAQVGVSWGSDTGARLIGKFDHNLINRKGYQAGAEIRLSEDKKGLKLYASKPMSHPLNDKLRASLSYDEEVFGQSTGGFDLSSRTLEQMLSRTIVNKTGWNRTYSLRYRLDELETRAPPETWRYLPVDFVDGRPTQEALLAGFALNKTVADDLVNPMRGYRQYYSLEAGTKSLLSSANMAIARAGVSGVYSFGDNVYGKDRAHQLSGSLQGGYIWSDNFYDVPYRLRFFAGGDQSIRGYNNNSLAPLIDGYLSGGQALAVGSVEYNYEILKDLRLAVFADAGNAYDRNFSNETKVGAGLGIRWASPVGQVRVDVATGLKEEGTPIKLHFFIGTPF